MKRHVAVCLAILGLVATVRADVEVLWGVNGVSAAASNLYAINPATGEVVGTLSTGVSGLSGLALNPVTKILYATSVNAVAGNKNLYTLNQVTGQAAVVGPVGGGSGFPIADTAFRADGVLYAWRPQSNRIYTIDLATGAATQLAGSPSPVGSSGITFGSDGTLYMVRDNSLVTLNPAFGNVVLGPFVLSGATTSVDNLFATNSAGTLYAAKRNNKSAPTTLYTMTPAGVLTQGPNISAVSLSGMVFGSVPPPASFKAAKAKYQIKTATITLRGKATSPLSMVVSAKGKKATVVKGQWTLKLKLKRGRNVIPLLCVDGMGQATKSKVIVTRR